MTLRESKLQVVSINIRTIKVLEDDVGGNFLFLFIPVNVVESVKSFGGNAVESVKGFGGNAVEAPKGFGGSKFGEKRQFWRLRDLKFS